MLVYQRVNPETTASFGDFSVLGSSWFIFSHLEDDFVTS